MKQNWLASTAVGALLIAVPAIATPAVAREAADAATAAEPQAESDAGDVGAIVVTARRRAEDASKVPLSISAISSEQITRLGIRDITEVTKLAPGLTFSYSPSGKSNPFIVIRGQSRSTTGNTSPGVLVYLNDVPLPNAGSIVQTYDMANVQVLKGPQGTLFGRNAVGGAVLTNSQMPVYKFEGYARAEIAQYNTHSFEGAINVPLIKDRVALRVAGKTGREGTGAKSYVFGIYNIASNGAGGFVATPGELIPNPKLKPGEFTEDGIRVSLLVEPVDGVRNVTVYTYNKLHGTPAVLLKRLYDKGINDDGKNVALYLRSPAAISAALGPIGPAFASIDTQLMQCPSLALNCNVFTNQAQLQGRATKEGIAYHIQDPGNSSYTFKSVTNTTTVSLGADHQIKNIFGYTKIDNFTNSSLGGTAVPIFTSGQVYRTKLLTDELQASGSLLDKQLKYTVGGFLLQDDPGGAGGFGGLENNAFFGLSHSINGNYLKNRSKALYAQFDYSPAWLLPGLTLTAGLRQTWDKQGTCTTTRTISPLATGPGILIPTIEAADSQFPSEADCIANDGKAAGAGTLPAGTTSKVFPYQDFKKLTYTLGANYQITRDAMVYVTHRRGYRQGGYNVPLFDPFLASAQTFGSETLTDWEIGTKLRWRGDNGMSATLNIALYTGKDKGNQVPVTTANVPAGGVCIPEAIGSAGRVSDCTTLASQLAYTAGTPGVRVRHTASTTINNSADLTISGIDVDGTFSPTSWLTLSGGIGYVHVKVDRFTLEPTVKTLLTAAGLFVPDAAAVLIQGQPKWTGTAGVYAEYPGKVLGGTLSGTVAFNYTGRYQAGQINIPSSRFADVRVSLSDIGSTGLDVSVWCKNVTDSILHPGSGSSAPSSLGVTTLLYGQARTAGMSLAYKF